MTNLQNSSLNVDVAIIGGGPAGTGALWALARRDPTLKLALIEKTDKLGTGSSTASLENFRSAWITHCIAQQMKRSVEVFMNADEYLGEGATQSLHVKQQGYLFCAFNDEQAEIHRKDAERLQSLGMTRTEFLEIDEVRYRFNWVGERVIAAKFDPTAGWLDSNALIHRFAKVASPQTTFVYNVPEPKICVENGHVTGVETPHGKVNAPIVVIACGAGARQVGRTAGIEIPMMLRPRQSFTTGWRHAPFPHDAPMLIGARPFPHVRPEAREGAIFGFEYRWHTKAYADSHGSNDAKDAIIEPVHPLNQLKDPRFPSLTLALMARQFGHSEGEGFLDGRYMRGVYHNIGYYVHRDAHAAYRIDADGNHHPYDSERAIIDKHPDVEGLILSVAHVGHGVMSSPAAGEHVAALVMGDALPDPSYADFALNANWVGYDEAIL